MGDISLFIDPTNLAAKKSPIGAEVRLETISPRKPSSWVAASMAILPPMLCPYRK
jgi:hypothetical protein